MALKSISSVTISGEIYLLIQFHELPVSLSLHDCLSTSDSLVGLDFLYFLKLIIYYTRYRDAVAEGALQITRSTETKFHSPTTQINFCLFVCFADVVIAKNVISSANMRSEFSLMFIL